MRQPWATSQIDDNNSWPEDPDQIAERVPDDWVGVW